MNATLASKPALGAYLNTPEVQEAREQMMWRYRMSRIDHATRFRAYDAIARIASGIRTGRRLDLIASDLLVLATQLEDVLQPRNGGWPLGRVL